MATSNLLMLLATLVLLLPQVLSQPIYANISTTTSSSLLLPSPVHSDVPPPPLPTSCTINSLTSPDVTLTSFLYQADDAKSLHFTLKNRMSGWTTSCEGTGHGLITGDCSESPTTSEFQYDSTTSMLTVNQSWVCNDSPTTTQPIQFAGTGTAKLAVKCSQDASNSIRCTAPQDTRIPLSLSAPLSLTPVLPPPAAGHDNPGCMATSLGSPTWVISDFKWSTGGVSTPGFIWPTITPHGAFQLNVTNTATNATISCITYCGGYIASNLSVPTDPIYMFSTPGSEDLSWCPCLRQTKGTAYNNNYYTYTNMLVDPLQRILAIDQTWYCDDENAKNPVQFTASGQISLPALSCVPRPYDDVSLNAGYGPTMEPLFNGSTCSATNSFTATGALTSQNKMEPFALQLPRPTQRGCTTASIILQYELNRNYTYDLNGFEYNAYDTLNNSNSNYEVVAQLDFVLSMQGLDVQLDCRGWDPRLNRQTKDYAPNYWWSCLQYQGVDPGGEGGSQHDDLQSGLVNFDAINYVLNFNITWACSDINPSQKPVFQWITSAQLPELHCVKKDGGGLRTHCTIPWEGTNDTNHYWVNFSDEIRNIS